jgi:hypothetical protein
LTQSSFRIDRKQAGGEASERGVRSLNFHGLAGQCGSVARDSGKITARDRASPGFFGSEALEIRQSPANERQKSHFRTAARKADVHEKTHGAFDDDQERGRGEGAGGVIDGLGISTHGDGKAAYGASYAARDALRARIAVDSKDHAFERRRAAPAESLERVNRARGGAATRQRSEHRLIERATGMQDHFAAPLFAADAREFGGNFGDSVVRSGDQNDVSVEHAAGNTIECVAGANGASRGTR